MGGHVSVLPAGEADQLPGKAAPEYLVRFHKIELKDGKYYTVSALMRPHSCNHTILLRPSWGSVMHCHCVLQVRVYSDGVIDEDEMAADADMEDGEAPWGEEVEGWLQGDDVAGIGGYERLSSDVVRNPLYFPPAAKAAKAMLDSVVMVFPILHDLHPQLSGDYNGTDMVPDHGITNR